MDDTTAKLGLSLLLLCSVLGVVLTLAGSLQMWLRREQDWFAATLAELYLTGVTPRFMIMASALCVVAGAMVGGLLSGSALVGVAVGGVCYFLPRGYLYTARQTRRRRLNEQIVDGILTISNGVSAGLNLPAALELVEKNAPAPISQEIGYLLREYEYGVPIDVAMERAAERVQLPNYRLLFLAMRTGLERGGRLADTLKTIAESLREISRLEDKVETMTQQGRSSARLMSLMPLGVLGILYLIDPAAVNLLFTTAIGKVLLVVVGAVLVTGWVWMQRIVSVDV